MNHWEQELLTGRLQGKTTIFNSLCKSYYSLPANKDFPQDCLNVSLTADTYLNVLQEPDKCLVGLFRNDAFKKNIETVNFTPPVNYRLHKLNI